MNEFITISYENILNPWHKIREKENNIKRISGLYHMSLRWKVLSISDVRMWTRFDISAD